MASLEDALENIGVSVFIGEVRYSPPLGRRSDHVDFARELISELNRNADSKEASEQINIEDLPPVSGWAQGKSHSSWKPRKFS